MWASKNRNRKCWIRIKVYCAIRRAIMEQVTRTPLVPTRRTTFHLLTKKWPLIRLKNSPRTVLSLKIWAAIFKMRKWKRTFRQDRRKKSPFQTQFWRTSRPIQSLRALMTLSMNLWNVKKNLKLFKIRIFWKIRFRIRPKSRKNRLWVKKLFWWMTAQNRFFQLSRRPKFTILRKTTRNSKIYLLWAQMGHSRAFSSNPLKTKIKGSKVHLPDTTIIFKKYACMKTWLRLQIWVQSNTVLKATSPHNFTLCIRTSKSAL